MSVAPAFPSRRESILRRNPYTSRRSFVARAMALEPIGDIADVSLTSGAAETLTWETATEWDNAVSESGVAHESTTDTDHDDATLVKQGYSLGTPFLNSNLLALYGFHEDSGTTVHDLKGTNDVTISGATANETGLLGTTAYSFDGSDDGGTATELSGVSKSTDFSVNIWFYPSDSTQGELVNNKVSNSDDFAITWDSDDNEIVSGAIDDGTEDIGDAGASVPSGINTWYMFTYVFDSATPSNSVAYLNASLGSSTNTVFQINASNGLYFGQRSDGAAPFAGKLTMASFYDKQLSSSEVQTLYDVVDTAGTLTAATKTFSSSTKPDLQNLDYSLNGVTDIKLDIIGSPGGAGEETVTQQLDGATSYSLTWSNSHTDFRVKLYPDNENDVTRTPTINKVELTTP